MANSAPGVNINVVAAASNPRANNPTGTWFVLGNASGPAGVAVPVNSMTDFNTYFGRVVNGAVTGRYTVTAGGATLDSTALYDAMDVYFREGGIISYVSLIQPASGGVAATITSGANVFTAISKGTWANSTGSTSTGPASTPTAGVYVQVSCTATGVYFATIYYNSVIMATSPALSGDTDLRNWVNSLPAYRGLLVASAASGSPASNLPSSGASLYIYPTGGTDVATADTDQIASLAAFTDVYGPGQVSFPAATTGVTYQNLTSHAQAFNRVAVLDAANTATAATLVSAVTTLQGLTANTVNTLLTLDPSYASFFASWLIVPGTVNTNPAQTTGLVFNRTVAPSALAAANMASNDQSFDCNVPAAGIVHGSSVYAVNVSQAYSAVDRATLNNAGVNVVRNVPNTATIAVYGFRSAAFDTNWVYLNNVRFRMQIVRDFDILAESFMFSEIDGRGQVFSTLNGALAGQCQAYWTRKSIYGTTPAQAFSVNTGPQVNTPVTIAAGQINAQVNVRMAPFGEFVTVTVTKYLVNATLPSYTN
jgi:hypothetical protein